MPAGVLLFLSSSCEDNPLPGRISRLASPESRRGQHNPAACSVGKWHLRFITNQGWGHGQLRAAAK